MNLPKRKRIKLSLSYDEGSTIDRLLSNDAACFVLVADGKAVSLDIEYDWPMAKLVCSSSKIEEAIA